MIKPRSIPADLQPARERLRKDILAAAETVSRVTIGLDGKVVEMPTSSGSRSPAFEIKTGPDGTTDLVASRQLTPSDFEAIREAVRAPLLTARKTGFVSARKATHEEPIETRWNGKETSSVANPGDWIVTNMSADRTVLRDREGSVNTYVIRKDTFPRLYGRDVGETEYGAIYKSTSAIQAFLLPGAFEIVAPWGEIQHGSQGYLIRNGAEVYGNNRETFEATYEVIDSQPGKAG